MIDTNCCCCCEQIGTHIHGGFGSARSQTELNLPSGEAEKIRYLAPPSFKDFQTMLEAIAKDKVCCFVVVFIDVFFSSFFLK